MNLYGRKDAMRKTTGTLTLAILTVVLGTTMNVNAANAANINTHGTACDTTGWNFLYFYADGVVFRGSGTAVVLCPVPRSPLGTNPWGQFYVDGDNPAGATTTVTIYSYNYNGTFLGSVSGSATSAGPYDMNVSLTAAQLPTYAYTSAYVVLPFNGKFRGITSIQ